MQPNLIGIQLDTILNLNPVMGEAPKREEIAAIWEAIKLLNNQQMVEQDPMSARRLYMRLGEFTFPSDRRGQEMKRALEELAKSFNPMSSRVEEDLSTPSAKRPAYEDSSSSSSHSDFNSLPRDIIYSTFLRLPFEDMARLRRINPRLDSIGKDATVAKLNDDKVPLASLGINDADELLQVLDSLDPEHCSQVKRLNLSKLPINEGFFLQLSVRTPHLQSLNLTECNDITDEDIQFINQFSQLERLILSECEQVTSQCLRGLPALSGLRELNLMGCSIDDDDLENLKNFPRLETLNLRYCVFLTGEGLKHLKNLTELRNLNLAKCSAITSRDLQHIASLTNLETLNLSRTFPSITHGIPSLIQLTKLKNLSLTGCEKLTYENLKTLLNSLRRLETLNISYCEKITPEDQAALKADIPDLRIIN